MFNCGNVILFEHSQMPYLCAIDSEYNTFLVNLETGEMDTLDMLFKAGVGNIVRVYEDIHEFYRYH